MTNPSFDPTIAGTQNLPPVSSAAAAERERNLHSAEAGDAANSGDAGTPSATPAPEISAPLTPADDEAPDDHEGRHRR